MPRMIVAPAPTSVRAPTRTLPQRCAPGAMCAAASMREAGAALRPGVAGPPRPRARAYADVAAEMRPRRNVRGGVDAAVVVDARAGVDDDSVAERRLGVH